MGDNAVVTIEECETGINCDGLAIPNPCPVIDDETIVKPVQNPDHVTIDPNAYIVDPVSENPDITEDTSSGNILKAFGFIIALLAILV